MKSQRHMAIPLLLAAALVVAACTGEVSESTATAPTATVATVPSTVAAATTTIAPAPTTTEAGPSPEEIGEAFIEARDAYDADTAEALFASDAVIHDDYMTTASEYHAHFAWHESADWEWRTDQCSLIETGPPAEVTCKYTMENAWSKALGVDPISGGSFHFVISEGLIQEITHLPNLASLSDVWGRFHTWVGTNHPEDRQTMYLNDGRAASWTPESVALFDLYTDEFVATVTATTTP